jgi:GNAT superfamily N-acetyltransferase
MEQYGPLTIRNSIMPGDVDGIVRLHGVLYNREYGLDATFEPYVAIPLAEFSRSQGEREKIWIVEQGGTVRGSIAIVRHDDARAQLRWFLLDPALRGRGLGKKLASEAVRFSGDSGYASLFLWTLGILAAAASIYTTLGFYLTEEKTGQIWGRELTEQRYELNLRPF